MVNKSSTIDELKEFEILNIGMMKKIRGGCGGVDQDRMCSGSCGNAGCIHDGCCMSWWDWGGDSACKGSCKEVVSYKEILGSQSTPSIQNFTIEANNIASGSSVLNYLKV
jgi:hypothetical protein